MGTKAESGEFILKLYELRREEMMRKARNWFFAFNPETLEEVLTTARVEHSDYYRVVTSCGDIACSLVNHGVIDEGMFNDANAEYAFIYAKIKPFVEQIRAMTNPQYMSHLDKLMVRLPEVELRLAYMREMSKSVARESAPQQAGTDKAQAAF